MTDAQTESEVYKSKLLYQLCAHLAQLKSESDLLHIYKIATNTISNASDKGTPLVDELLICENIQKKIGLEHGKENALVFVDILRKLKSLAVLKKRPEILSLLLSLSHSPDSEPGNPTLLIEKALREISSKHTMTSKPTLLDSRSSVLKDTSWENNCENNNSKGSRPQTLAYQGTRMAWKESPTTVKTPTALTSTTISSSEGRIPFTLSAYQHSVSEITLLQDLIYCFQGISGKYLCLDAVTNSFYIDPMVQLSRPRRCLVMQLAELGYLHNRLRSLSDNLKQRAQQLGLMAQSLASCISEELTEFYRLLAVLQSQLQLDKCTEAPSPLSDGASRVSAESQQSPSLTLRQMQAHVADPIERFRWLVAICEACKDKRGGAIASAIHGFLEHGDPALRLTVKHLLTSVCKPLYCMLSRWILDGELEDPYNEFFIQTNQHVSGNDQLWHDKYKVRESMVPSFISMAQARKILATGKSINFLRQVCQDHSPVKGREVLRRALGTSSVEAMFPAERDSDLHSLMDNTYLEVSRRVLDVLNTKYKFMEHMQALRRYLLLGQGDFIRHLMDLLEPELRKQASEVYNHNLTAILESAIRATNAQFEDESILSRLDVRLSEPSAGDTGWDVFCLDYNVDGPIGTVFSSCSSSYHTLFYALWKAKRTEWILSKMWKRLTTSAKMLARIPELTPLLHQTYLLSSEMIHLVHQLQYYFLFEVMECSWAKLISCVQQADGLDDIIRAHDTFLCRVKAGALVDDASQELASRLRTVYDCIVKLQVLEEALHLRVVREIQRRVDYEQLVEEDGTNTERERENERALRDFDDVFLASNRTNLRMLAESYEHVVKKFLLQLASHSDMSLQLLSSRLDFNEHYKRRDSRLTAPLTYQHRRREISSEPPETFC